MTVKVEALVKATIPLNSEGTQRYDIIAIYPAGTPWGKGDLAGNFVFVMAIDLPCGNKFTEEGPAACNNCEHVGVVWESKTLVTGTKGVPKTTCPIEHYTTMDGVYTFEVLKSGVPITRFAPIKKRMVKLDYSKLLSLDSITKSESDTVLTDATKEATLLEARKPSNEITILSIEAKSGITC